MTRPSEAAGDPAPLNAQARTGAPRIDGPPDPDTDPSAQEPPVLRVEDLRTHIQTKAGLARAVDGVDFELRRGETVGLVGESGSGKSMTALSILRLHPQPAARIVSGRVEFNGTDLLSLSEREMRRVRGRHIALILQDPMTALNPVYSVGDQIAEPVRLHQRLRGLSLVERTLELLRLLRIADPEARRRAYPHQLSGGMRQRVVGAIALSCAPEVLIADEPTTALDATVQAAYLELLKDLQRKMHLAILFITHDFGVVGRMCDRVVVMYAGRVVETATRARLFQHPGHPYTHALLRSVPTVAAPTQRLLTIEGQPPPVTEFPPGCRFHPRCWLYERLGRPELCRTDLPLLQATGPNAQVACHFAAEVGRHRPDMGEAHDAVGVPA